MLTEIPPIRKRRHRRLDRDAPLPLKSKGIGLRVALVDASWLVDYSGRIEQPLS
jgi:hypothetical protein